MPAGFSLYVKDGRSAYDYNFAPWSRTSIAATEPHAPGKNVLLAEFRYDGGGLGKGGTVSLFVNDRKVATGRLEATIWTGKYSADETFDIGADTGSPVSADYASPNRFTGTIKKVVIDTQPAKLSAADQEKLQGMEQKARLAVE